MTVASIIRDHSLSNGADVSSNLRNPGGSPHMAGLAYGLRNRGGELASDGGAAMNPGRALVLDVAVAPHKDGMASVRDTPASLATLASLASLGSPLPMAGPATCASGGFASGARTSVMDIAAAAAAASATAGGIVALATKGLPVSSAMTGATAAAVMLARAGTGLPPVQSGAPGDSYQPIRFAQRDPRVSRFNSGVVNGGGFSVASPSTGGRQSDGSGSPLGGSFPLAPIATGVRRSDSGCSPLGNSSSRGLASGDLASADISPAGVRQSDGEARPNGSGQLSMPNGVNGDVAARLSDASTRLNSIGQMSVPPLADISDEAAEAFAALTSLQGGSPALQGSPGASGLMQMPQPDSSVQGGSPAVQGGSPALQGSPHAAGLMQMPQPDSSVQLAISSTVKVTSSSQHPSVILRSTFKTLSFSFIITASLCRP